MAVDLYQSVEMSRGKRNRLEATLGRPIEPLETHAMLAVDQGVLTIEDVLADLQARGFSFWRILSIVLLRRRSPLRRDNASAGELYVASLDSRDDDWIVLDDGAPEDLRLARAAASEACGSGGAGITSAQLIRDGLCDHSSEVQSALAAIRRVRGSTPAQAAA